eukprot:TRINITY_DN26001_c3_g1_i1.p1 TRINITY_DN26001_c3_g1~~TRINITY_DN26001_c3_g1_i1.p1  ORF type:complete len:631 (+),score=198.45 TRINITY_DN26001_c3_g1_i1:119-2011(+)
MDNKGWKERGPTPPISTDVSSAEDLAFTKGFDEMIAATIEGRNESIRREEVLVLLNQLVKAWVAGEARQQGYSEADARKLGGRIYSFGSFRLGVHGPGADIDTLVLVPELVKREMFFTTLHDTLKNHPEVTDLVPVPDATVPVMKLKVRDINIDLLFASLEVPRISDDFEVLEDKILKGVDPQTQRALNGPRVATQMLNCVPNVHTFRAVLRAVKKWANARGVYGNIVGYPGGIAWAILTARVCQLYPNLSAANTFCKLFTFYAAWWKSAKERARTESSGPIYLTRDLDYDKGYGFEVWNHKVNPRNRHDTFPVITPCYPYMNSCYNVSATTLETILTEFKRGDTLVKEARKRFEADGTPLDWEKMMEPTDFFVRYQQYLRIRVPSKTEDDGRRWSGFVESRMRRFFPQLELIRGLHAQILPRDFCVQEDPALHNGATISFNSFIGLDLSNVPDKGEVRLDTAWAKFMSHVTAPECYNDRSDNMLDPVLTCVSRKQLLKECAFALSDADKQAVREALSDKKRKRAEQKERAADDLRQREAKAARSLSAGKKPMPDPLLPPPPPSPQVTPVNPGVPVPSPKKTFSDSPAMRPAAPPGLKSISASRSPGSRRGATPNKVRTLTDKLMADEGF